MATVTSHPWGFYGRRLELDQVREILRRERWFFLKVSGRRRIGKTSLVQQALEAEQRQKVLYLQVPDSDPAGVVSAPATSTRCSSSPRTASTRSTGSPGVRRTCAVV